MRNSDNVFVNGKAMSMYTIANQNGLSAVVTNYGAKIMRLYVPDRNNQLEDVVLGFDTLQETINREEYFGAVCGRVANRIKNGRFTLDRHEYQLSTNCPPNALHGGFEGFNRKVWHVVSVTASKIMMSLFSPHGEEGYPGNLRVIVTYEFTNDNSLRIRYEATTDKPTVIGLTQHSYFNLKGAGKGSVRDHFLQVNADFVTELDADFVATGEIRPVNDTPFDFRSPTLIDDRIDDEVYLAGRGIDYNWCICRAQQGDCAYAASIYEPSSGRKMELYTTLPGVQVYTGNWIDKQVGKCGMDYDAQHAICLEAQAFPNSVNVPFFPSTVLRPGEKYDHYCIYKFLAE